MENKKAAKLSPAAFMSMDSRLVGSGGLCLRGAGDRRIREWGPQRGFFRGRGSCAATVGVIVIVGFTTGDEQRAGYSQTGEGKSFHRMGKVHGLFVSVVVVVVFFSSVVEVAGGVTMIVLFSTLGVGAAGGVMTVVFFSITLSAGGLLVTLSSQEARSAQKAARMMGVFMVDWIKVGLFTG